MLTIKYDKIVYISFSILTSLRRWDGSFISWSNIVSWFYLIQEPNDGIVVKIIRTNKIRLIKALLQSVNDNL